MNIRDGCLRPAACWLQPTGEEVREVLKLTGLTGSAAAKFLGLGVNGDRTVRRWIGNESAISYANWALLCCLAGHSEIWNKASS